MADNEKINAALAQLDPLDDDQWTAEGAPKVEVVSGLMGEAIRRQDIINASPKFTRETAGATDDETKDDETVGASKDDEVTGGAPKEDDDPEDDEPVVSSELMTVADFVKWLAKVPKEELEEVEASLKKQNDDIGNEITKLKDLQVRISQAVSMTRDRIKQEFPNSANQHAIREFIAAQAASRAERIARRQSILQGIKPDELDARSPLDAAMARKTKRGTKRPARALMK